MKTVLITGAASGLGLELARAYAGAGDRLCLVDRDGEGLKGVIAELQGDVSVSGVTADLTDEEDMRRLVRHVQEHCPRLDVLVNNAGITHRSLAARTRIDVFRQVMAVDWQAPVELTLALLPLLRASGGSVVNIGSMAGWMPVPGRAGYCSAKAALGQFFEVLRAEEQGSGLHILMVYPSFLDTPIERNALGADGLAARHARSTVGSVSSAATLAGRILRAERERTATLFPDRGTWLASILWRLWPSLFHRLLRRRFAGELQQ